MYTNPAQLIEKLEKLPNEIYEAEKKMLEAKEILNLTELEFDTEFAFALLGAQKPNATEKKSEAIIATRENKKGVLKANIEFERRKAHLNALTHKFVALRKVASIEERLMAVGASGN